MRAQIIGLLAELQGQYLPHLILLVFIGQNFDRKLSIVKGSR